MTGFTVQTGRSAEWIEEGIRRIREALRWNPGDGDVQGSSDGGR